MKIYTKQGDGGLTHLLNERVSKTNSRIQIIGELDEVMVLIGKLISSLEQLELKEELKHIYKQTFTMQAVLADVNQKHGYQITKDEINFLEQSIDRMDQSLPQLQNFIYCTGHETATSSHLTRVKVRAVERLLVHLNEVEKIEQTVLAYMNRLSDYFFTLARYLNQLFDVEEEIIRL
jgi:cob(I)alamin adenosyltransferase